MKRHKPEPEVYSVSGVRESLHDDLDLRMKRYLISMSIRTVCFLLAVLFRHSWVCWVFVTFAVVLPYIAVVLANAGRSASPQAPEVLTPSQQAIEARPVHRIAP